MLEEAVVALLGACVIEEACIAASTLEIGGLASVNVPEAHRT